MRTTLFKRALLAVVTMAFVCFTACSDDPDPKPVPDPTPDPTREVIQLTAPVDQKVLYYSKA
ncbi:MAG: hypothetical protein RR279_07115, partial [Alistipes sp.]